MDFLALAMFPFLLALLFLGFPVAFSMMSTALVFGLLTFGDALIYQLMDKVEDVASNFVLAAVPLFVFMGSMLERSGIAAALYEAIHVWTRRLPGGLALGTVIMCVIFAASTGVIGATETVVGLLAIPVMLKYAYRNELIAGTICAGGSLGTIIPPSVVVVVLGPIADVSVGDLMVGMIFPGLILAALYLLYILVLCIVSPTAGPVLPREPDEPSLGQKLGTTARALLPPLLMIFAVLGSIMLGWAAPTEAAGIGAAGAVVLTVFYRSFTFRALGDAMLKTLKITSMIMLILLAGNMLTGVFVSAGGSALTQRLVEGLALGPWGVLVLVLFLAFVAGFFLDWISIVLILVPIFTPVLRVQGVDVVWFCILFLIVIQTSYLTPPMAPAIFYLRGISPPEMTLDQMYRGVVPFIVAQFVCLAIVMAFPQTVLWLPSKLLGFR